MDSQKQRDSSYLERLVALKALRENIFFSEPGKYSYTDIAEDLPGVGKPVGQIVKNILPSAAIISQDLEERKKQIDAAIAKIKASRGSKEGLGKEILHNIIHLGGGALLPGFLLGGAAHLAFRNPFGKMLIKKPGVVADTLGLAKNAPREDIIKALENLAAKDSRYADLARPIAGPKGNAIQPLSQYEGPDLLEKAELAIRAKQPGVYTTTSKLRWPTDLFRNLKRLFSSGKLNAAYRKKILQESAGNALQGAGLMAAGGIAYPLLTHYTGVSDKALEEARKVMEQEPYITSLPTSEMLSVVKEKTEANNTSQNKLKNVLMGAGLGAVTEGAAGTLPTALAVGLGAAGSLIGRGKPLAAAKIIKQLKRDVGWSTALGGGLGALSGATTKNVLADNPVMHSNSHAANPDAYEQQAFKTYSA